MNGAVAVLHKVDALEWWVVAAPASIRVGSIASTQQPHQLNV
jgi:hypothetical protein